MKYIFVLPNTKNEISYNYNNGATNRSIRLTKDFSEYFNYISLNEYKPDKNIKYIWLYQSNSGYPNTKWVNKFNDIVYIRNRFSNLLPISYTGGFNYFKSSKIKRFVPLIPSYSNIINPTEITIGFRVSFKRKDVNDQFKNFLNTINKDIPVIVLGKNNKYLLSLNRKIKIVNNTDDFFSNITHLYYPQSKIFKDPNPLLLQEAIECNKEIIIPDIIRNFYDGIDDIKSCIKTHKSFNPNKEYNYNNCILKSNNFKIFIEKMIKNNFNYILDKNKYKTYYDWCIKEL